MNISFVLIFIIVWLFYFIKECSISNLEAVTENSEVLGLLTVFISAEIFCYQMQWFINQPLLPSTPLLTHLVTLYKNTLYIVTNAKKKGIKLQISKFYSITILYSYLISITKLWYGLYVMRTFKIHYYVDIMFYLENCRVKNKFW